MDDEMQQPPQRERVGQRAWVRTVGLVGGGLVAGGILAGTLSANAATDESTTSVPSYTQEGTTTPDGGPARKGAGPGGQGGRMADGDCPEDAAGSTDEGSTEDGTTETPSTEGSSADAAA